MLWTYTQRHTKVLLLATILVFSAYGLMLAQGWRDIARQESLTANTVGVLAGVPQNPVNSYMSELNERERTLAAREAALARANDDGTDATTLRIATVMGGILFLLIMLNFYLDHKRRLSLS